MSANEEQQGELRCRPGDLAIVTKSGVRSLVGLVVEILEHSRDLDHDWLIEIQGRGIEAPGMHSGLVMQRRRGLMRDDHLSPISRYEHSRQTVQMHPVASEASARTFEVAHHPCQPG